MQNVNTMIRRPVPFGTTVATGLLAFAAGALIAVGAPVAIAGLSTSDRVNASVSASAVGAEQVAHNRSEAGLAGTTSAGAEQIGHNRSEQGLARR
jgi:hypothetical protein